MKIFSTFTSQRTVGATDSLFIFSIMFSTVWFLGKLSAEVEFISLRHVGHLFNTMSVMFGKTTFGILNWKKITTYNKV